MANTNRRRIGNVPKRSVTVGNRKTSVTLEDAFWRHLKAMAADKNLPLSRHLAEIEAARAPGTSLTSAVRQLVVADLENRRAALEAV